MVVKTGSRFTQITPQLTVVIALGELEFNAGVGHIRTTCGVRIPCRSVQNIHHCLCNLRTDHWARRPVVLLQERLTLLETLREDSQYNCGRLNTAGRMPRHNLILLGAHVKVGVYSMPLTRGRFVIVGTCPSVYHCFSIWHGKLIGFGWIVRPNGDYFLEAWRYQRNFS